MHRIQKVKKDLFYKEMVQSTSLQSYAYFSQIRFLFRNGGSKKYGRVWVSVDKELIISCLFNNPPVNAQIEVLFKGYP